MNRKERRAHLKGMNFLHTKAFEKSKLQETVLDDGSIKFEIE